MKRKPVAPAQPASAEPVIDQKLLDQVNLSVLSDPMKRVEKCSVCGANCAPNSTEGLCWVCRRLKISAWRDTDQQAVQE